MRSLRHRLAIGPHGWLKIKPSKHHRTPQLQNIISNLPVWGSSPNLAYSFHGYPSSCAVRQKFLSRRCRVEREDGTVAREAVELPTDLREPSCLAKIEKAKN